MCSLVGSAGINVLADAERAASGWSCGMAGLVGLDRAASGAGSGWLRLTAAATCTSLPTHQASDR